MIVIRFPDEKMDRRALEYLIGRFPFKSWDTLQMMLPERALGYLSRRGIRFEVEGPPTYEQAIPAVTNAAPSHVRPRKRRAIGLVGRRRGGYNPSMILIRFLDSESKRLALDFLIGRFSFQSWSTGEMRLPAEALPQLALEGIRFQVEGPSGDEKEATPTLRTPAASQV